MGCFVVPMAEAIVVSIVKKVVKKKKENTASVGAEDVASLNAESKDFNQTKLDWEKKLSWLNQLLWGGVFLLAIEHIWHGEVVLWPPFLTAMSNPSEIPIMLHEMATIGTSMAVFVTLVWGVMVYVAKNKIKQTVPKECERN
ncbi:hypothetical protein [Anaerotignum propionicum]|uniref:hypothetical protein n=1 Tax=Anaerotignum propionicum TaxID=28446 RepID=UPI0028A1646E|nr:hypothetical protein [Anaerotignum propionicum]